MEAERRALWMSVVGALFFAGLGFGFSILTDSEAILLDGFFSLIGFFMGLLSLRVARLVQGPDDRHFHFGYAAFEPMLNMAKGLIILGVCAFAFASALGTALDGGSDIQAGWGVLYAGIATLGCFALAGVQLRVAKTTGSQLVAVDAKSWLIDGLMSFVVAIAFGVAFWLSSTGLAHLVPYVDPGLVMLLTLLMIPIPIRIMARGAGELLKTAPEASVQTEIRSRVGEVLDEAGLDRRVMRMARVGREFWLLIHVLVAADHEIGDVASADRIRERIHSIAAAVEPGMVVDVMFTGREDWT